MSFFLIFNDAGLEATAVSSSTVASDYDEMDLISGPRNRIIQSSKATTFQFDYETPGTGSGTTDADCMVIARADLLLGDLTNIRVDIDKGSGITTHSTITAATLSANLVGYKGTDYVGTFTEDIANTWRLQVNNASSSVIGLSKVYFSNRFSFNKSPKASIWRNIPETDRLISTTPSRHLPYRCEAEIELSWRNLSKAKLQSFLGIDQLLNWPLFLWDSTQAIWSYELEHVILTSYRYLAVGQDQYDLECTFRRLEHYE